uniref:HMG box domain-containing protein n=1 Tax=Panagrellus redivivus TaxID=6233 RepID=A0A7E4ZRJ4_PANRE
MSYYTRASFDTPNEFSGFKRYSLGKEEIMRKFEYYSEMDIAVINKMLYKSWKTLTECEKEAFQAADNVVIEDIELNEAQQAMMDNPNNGTMQYTRHMMKLLQLDPKFERNRETFDMVWRSWDELIPESRKIYMAQKRRFLLNEFKNWLQKKSLRLPESCNDNVVQTASAPQLQISEKNHIPNSEYVQRLYNYLNSRATSAPPAKTADNITSKSPEIVLQRESELPKCVFNIETSEKMASKNTKPKKAPTAFACFVHDKRPTLMADPTFAAADVKEQIKRLKNAWDLLDGDSKFIYEEKEKRARARAEKKLLNGF